MFVIEEEDDARSFRQQQEAYVEALLRKWDWLIEGTQNGLKPLPKHLHRAMAIMFENQQAVSKGLLSEQTTTADIVIPDYMAMPIIREVFPRLWASKVCSVQPLPLASGGAGKIFFLKTWREDVSPDTQMTVDDSDYAVGAENSIPKRVKLTVTSMDITAEKDILAAVWSQEVEEDAAGALGLNVRQTLVNAAAGEIAREHDQRILWEIYNGAATETTWSQTVAAGHTTKEWAETLVHALITADMNIWGTHYRRADWIVVGPTFFEWLLRSQSFVSTRTDAEMASTGIELVGRLSQLYDVYLSPYITTLGAVMGRYTRETVDTGYVIAPYIPLSPMPAIYAEMDPSDGRFLNTDKWTQNIRTRQAKAMVQNTMFARVLLTA
jgi:hypothetical protein